MKIILFFFLTAVLLYGGPAQAAVAASDSTLQGHYRPAKSAETQQTTQNAPTYGQLLGYLLPGLAAAGVGTLGLVRTIRVFRTGNSFLGLWALVALLGFGAAWWLLSRPGKRPMPPDERRLFSHRQWVLLAVLAGVFGLGSLLFVF